MIHRHVTSKIVLLTLLVALATSTPPPPNQDRSSPADVSLSITWNAYHKMALGTAVFVAGLGLAGSLAALFPLVAYKICYFLGGCQNTMDYFVDRFISDEVEGVGKTKRSADYFEPILMTLAKAYQKYEGIGDQAENERVHPNGVSGS